MTEQFDIVIVGGGVVGNAMALACRDLSVSVAQVEVKQVSVRTDFDYDVRTIGVAYTSRTLLKHLNVWPHVAPVAAPISSLHISDAGHFGKVRMHASEQGVDALGFVIEMPYLLQAMQNELQTQENLTTFCPYQVSALADGGDHTELTLDGEQGTKTIGAKLVIAADGQFSSLRQHEGIEAQHWDYEQTAIVANLSFSHADNRVAFERFTPEGPLAVLPLTSGRSGFIWTLENRYIDEFMAMSDDAFAQKVLDRFGYRFGEITRVGKRRGYPVALIKAEETVKPRFVVIGNAAQSIHPIAAQGMNLGLRDVAQLREHIKSALQSKADLGALDGLSTYSRARQRDRMSLVRGIDVAVRAFRNPLSGVIKARNSILLALELIPGAKSHLAKRAMGLQTPAPELCVED